MTNIIQLQVVIVGLRKRIEELQTRNPTQCKHKIALEYCRECTSTAVLTAENAELKLGLVRANVNAQAMRKRLQWLEARYLR